MHFKNTCEMRTLIECAGGGTSASFLPNFYWNLNNFVTDRETTAVSFFIFLIFFLFSDYKIMILWLPKQQNPLKKIC